MSGISVSKYYGLYQGLPAASGTLYVYQTGTTTPVTPYADALLTTPLTNPITLDSNGCAVFFYSGTVNLKLVAYTASGAFIEALDPVYPNGAGTSGSASVPWAVATGTSDIVTATYNPVITALSDGLLLSFRASATNTTTTPTFAPNGLTAYDITAFGGAALVAGNITAQNAEYLIRYNLANTRWELLNPTYVLPKQPIVYNSITGCLISGITGNHTTAACSISAGQAANSTNTAYIVSAGYSWAASNGNAINGTDAASSTLANSTTYHMYLCSGASGTGTFASASLSPTFPAGYATYSRRISSFNTNGSGSPIPYASIEAEGGATIHWLTSPVLDIDVSNLGTSQTLYTLSVPSGVKMQLLYRASTTNQTVNIILTSGDETDVAPATTTGSGGFSAAPGADLTSQSSGGIDVFVNGSGILTTNASGQIGARATTTSVSLYLVTRGWKDFRRS